MEDVLRLGLPIYDFPFDAEEDPEEVIKECLELKVLEIEKR
jgi:hypothetical protein